MKAKLFIPGLTGILGEQGSGKSYAALKIATQYANQIEYDLCFNFEVSLNKLWDYCREMNYTWLLHRIYHNHIRYKPSEDLEEWMDRPRTIYVLDEAGVYLNSRNWGDISKEFLHSLAQIRHDNKMLFWIAQYYDMSDKLLRNLTAAFVQCQADLRFNPKLGNSEIIWQRIYLYDSRSYRIYLSKVADKYQGIKHWINARKLARWQWEGWLSEEDKMIFDIYQSFGSRVGDGNFENDLRFNHSYKIVDHNNEQLEEEILTTAEINRIMEKLNLFE